MKSKLAQKNEVSLRQYAAHSSSVTSEYALAYRLTPCTGLSTTSPKLMNSLMFSSARKSRDLHERFKHSGETEQ